MTSLIECCPPPRMACLPSVRPVRTSSFSRVRICKRLRSPGIDSKESIPTAYGVAGWYDNHICRPGPPGLIGWRNRFLGSLNVYKFGLCWQSWKIISMLSTRAVKLSPFWPPSHSCVCNRKFSRSFQPRKAAFSLSALRGLFQHWSSSPSLYSMVIYLLCEGTNLMPERFRPPYTATKAINSMLSIFKSCLLSASLNGRISWILANIPDTSSHLQPERPLALVPFADTKSCLPSMGSHKAVFLLQIFKVCPHMSTT